ncbi:hypothetical protein FRB97_004227 [Tulasnella sp. 331]|nr:hypothetical protein FRB97_004227 [Tulasnella sp. 331]
MIHSLNYAGQARPVVKTIHDGKLERCYYVLQWDKKTKAFAWTEFSDQESPQFVGEAEAWRKLGRLIKLLKVPMGESFGGKTFMVIDEDTNLIDPTYYFETTKWTQQRDCRRHANAFAGLVYDLFLQTAQKGITSTFDQRYLRVNRSFTKAFYIGFNTPKGLKKSQPPSDIANAAKASAASLWNARSPTQLSGTIFSPAIVNGRRDMMSVPESLCPYIWSFAVLGIERKVIDVSYLHDLERCHYTVQWEAQKRVLVWSDFSGIAGSVFNIDQAAWQQMEQLLAVLSIPEGEDFGGYKFLVIDQETSLYNPMEYLIDVAQEGLDCYMSDYEICQELAGRWPELVYRLFYDTMEEKGMTSMFDSRLVWVNLDFTKAYFLGFSMPKRLQSLDPHFEPMPPEASGMKRTAPSGGGPSTKKARFTDDIAQAQVSPSRPTPPDDGQAFLDETLEDLDAPGSARRGKIKTEGYDSDSSDDGEGVVESRKKALRKKKKGDADADDVDMFGGDDDKQDSETEGAAKQKKDKFLNLGDIEGQEFGRNAGTDEDEEEEPEDEDDAARRAKKGMGYNVSSFNMKDEMDEGKFDEDGTFIRSFDPHQVHDKWMEGMDEREIKKARRSQKKIKEREEERQRKDADGLANKSKEELELQLLDYVRPGESVLQALSRLGAEKKKGEKLKPKKKLKSAKMALDPITMDVDAGSADPAQHPENSAIERVTALASTLMAMGELHVYEETHRTLVHSVKEAGLVSRDWVPPSAAPPPQPPPPPESLIKYQYRWSPEYLATTTGGAKPDEVFGPYGKDELAAWKNASFFGPAGDRIQLRRLGDEAWSDWDVVA